MEFPKEHYALFLCNKTRIAPEPWASTGIKCISVDLDCVPRTEGNITWICADVRDYLPPLRHYVFACAFPPCTDTAVSGARWFTRKGLRALREAIEIFEVCERICQWTEAPYFIENPVSTFSTYRGRPDYTFHPFEYTAIEPADNYTKKTCLWTGNGFVMPEACIAPHLPSPDDRIHRAPPASDRADFRSATPAGFAKAVCSSNRHLRISAIQESGHVPPKSRTVIGHT